MYSADVYASVIVPPYVQATESLYNPIGVGSYMLIQGRCLSPKFPPPLKAHFVEWDFFLLYGVAKSRPP